MTPDETRGFEVSQRLLTEAHARRNGGTPPPALHVITGDVDPEPATPEQHRGHLRFAERFARRYTGEFIHVTGLGWFAWDGQRWAASTNGGEVRALIALIKDAIRDSAELSAKDRDDLNRDIAKVESAGGMFGVLKIAESAAGIAVDADKLDAHLDLINTPDGVVDLRTGAVTPHDPALLLTKMAKGSYRPGYTHPDWDLALQALPRAEQTWYQTRVGQGITGYTTPDGIMPLLQGDGENGKSALTTDGLCVGLGDYADTASAKLFQSSRSEHSTEQADLRGQRFLIAEEMTEGRALDVTSLKRVQDVGQIKARYTHGNNFTFVASHSLFCTSNYEPVVSETDHGTWRRLALLIFPYTFRKPGEALDQPTDRRGDPGLKRRLRTGGPDVWDAMVTWAVEGAVRFYADPDHALVPTTKVQADTLRWRKKADRILGFWCEHLIPKQGSCILTTDMLTEFNSWLDGMGHNGWAKETFGQRFVSHTETKRHGVVQKQTREPTGLSRRGFAASGAVPAKGRVFVGVRFRTEDDEDGSDLQED